MGKKRTSIFFLQQSLIFSTHIFLKELSRGDQDQKKDNVHGDLLTR